MHRLILALVTWAICAASPIHAQNLRIPSTDYTRTFLRSSNAAAAVNALGLGNGVITFPSYTVATLPVSPGAGSMAYCSDALTSQGTGGYVRWNGTKWKTWDNVTASSTVYTFCTNAWDSMYVQWTPYTQVSATWGALHGGTFSDLRDFSTGTSSFMSTWTADTNGAVLYVSTGITSTGSGNYSGWKTASTLTTCDALLFGTKGLYVGTLCTAAETYWAAFGWSTLKTGAVPTTGAFLLHDCWNAFYTGTATNNWICTTVNGSTYEFKDSGVAVSTTVPCPAFIYLTSSACVFNVNGTHVTNSVAGALPVNTATLYSVGMITKTNGTTAMTAYFQFPYYLNHRTVPGTYSGL